MVPRNKSIAVKSITLNVQAFACTDSGLIPAVWVPGPQQQATGDLRAQCCSVQTNHVIVTASAGQVLPTPLGLHRFTPSRHTKF